MTEFDDSLSRLFAEARENPPAGDFPEKMAVRVRKARRLRAITRAIITTAAAGLALTLTPSIAAGSLIVASHLGDALTSPLGWLCYLAVAGWGLRRARQG